jgi:hypothetical protein
MATNVAYFLKQKRSKSSRQKSSLAQTTACASGLMVKRMAGFGPHSYGRGFDRSRWEGEGKPFPMSLNCRGKRFFAPAG